VRVQGELESTFNSARVSLLEYGLRFSQQSPVPCYDLLLFFNNIRYHAFTFFFRFLYVPFNSKFARHFWEINQKMGVFQAFPDGGLFMEREEKNSGS
jgi:hypothetical protein